MFTKILFATDGSDCSLGAAHYAACLAQKTGAAITILHVAEPIREHPFLSLPGFELGIDEDRLMEFQNGISRKIIGPAGEIFTAAGIPFERRTAIGHPARTIVEVAEKEGFDLIVVGSSGHGQAGALLLGSVSDRVAHLATCPVFIVKAAESSEPAASA